MHRLSGHLLLATLLVAEAAAGEAFQAIVAELPQGEVTVTLRGASPGGSIQLYRGTALGETTVDHPACGTVRLALSDAAAAADGVADLQGRRRVRFGRPRDLPYQALDVVACTLTAPFRLDTGPAAPIAASGQTTSYADRDDGARQLGVAAPGVRFVHAGRGAIRDTRSGLVWLEMANCFPRKLLWQEAVTTARDLAPGRCGLGDDTVDLQWRLPNVREYQTLFDYGRRDPALPAGHPFVDVRLDSTYWTSTTLHPYPNTGWVARALDGAIEAPSPFVNNKLRGHYFWAVSGP